MIQACKKGLLKSYGDCTNERSKLVTWKSKMHFFEKVHFDWPEQAAKEMNIFATDEKHPIGNNMSVEKATIEKQIRDIEKERTALGLDELIKSLSQEDQDLIEMVFVNQQSYTEAAAKLNLSKSGVQHRVDSLCKRVALLEKQKK